eukprot:3361-Heterococcus_DN1.PRE.1
MAQSKKAKEEKKAAAGTKAKPKQASKTVAKKAKVSARSEMERLHSMMINAEIRPIQYTDEQIAENCAMGHAYNVGMAKRHNAETAALRWKFALRDEALHALPPDLAEHARKEDEGDVPLWRRMATVTPPIPDFDPECWRRKLTKEADAKQAEANKALGL